MTIDEAYKAWSSGELSNSEFLNHLTREHNLLDNEMFIDLWYQLLQMENKIADELWKRITEKRNDKA
jgi:hypothetical protein